MELADAHLAAVVVVDIDEGREDVKPRIVGEA